MRLLFSAKNFHAPLGLFLLAIAAALLSTEMVELFIYQRSSIESGQWWRLITAHILHTNTAHLLLNISAVALLWLLHGKFYRNFDYIKLFIFSALIVSVGVYLTSPELTSYVGLSGVLHALFIWGALKDIGTGDKTGYLLILGVIIKVIHEQVYGASEQVSSLINASVAIDAHLWGVVSGVLYYTFSAIRNSTPNKA